MIMTYTSGVRNSPKNFLHKGAFKLKRNSIIIPSKIIVNLMIFLKGAQDQLPECDEHSVQSHNKVGPRCFNIFTQQPIHKHSMQNNRCAITKMFYRAAQPPKCLIVTIIKERLPAELSKRMHNGADEDLLKGAEEAGDENYYDEIKDDNAIMGTGIRLKWLQ